MIAFASRYGHQRVPDLLNMPRTDLDIYVAKVAKLMCEEKSAMSKAFEGG